MYMSIRTLDYVIFLHQANLSKTTKHWDGFVSHCINIFLSLSHASSVPMALHYSESPKSSNRLLNLEQMSTTTNHHNYIVSRTFVPCTPHSFYYSDNNHGSPCKPPPRGWWNVEKRTTHSCFFQSPA